MNWLVFLTLCTLLAPESSSTVTAQVGSVNRTTLTATELAVVHVDIACCEVLHCGLMMCCNVKSIVIVTGDSGVSCVHVNTRLG